MFKSITRQRISAPATLFLLGIGVALSLPGDTTLYVVLPTRAAQAGILLADVGLMLSINRAVRIFINGPYGILIERLPRRVILIPSLLMGGLSTLLYTVPGFGPMLIGRIIWGLSWSGIWLGSSTAVLDLTTDANRGRYVGRFHMWESIGMGGSALLGGVLVDALGYRPPFFIFSLMAVAMAVIWWLFLPETRPDQPESPAQAAPAKDDNEATLPKRSALIAAVTLMGLNWLVFLGMLGALLSLLLQERVGDSVGLPLATLTGLLAAVNRGLGMIASPAAGHLTDRWRSRWGLIVFALVMGTAAMLMIAEGGGVVVIAGSMLAAAATGILQTQIVTVAGDYGHRGRLLGILNTAGDIGSASGPLLAFALLSASGLRGAALFAVILLLVMLPWSVWLALREGAHSTSR